MDHKKYSEIILGELSSKYEKSFEISRLTYEMDGNAGNYYRAICNEEGSDVPFVACYYLNGSEYLLSEEVGDSIPESGDQPLLVDDYCTALLNEKVAESVLSSRLGISHAIVDVATVNHALDINDISKGVEYCVSNEDFKTKLSAYVFINTKEKNKTAAEDAVIQKLRSMNPYRCNLHIVNIDFESGIPSKYTQNIYAVEDAVASDEKVISHRRYKISEDAGVTLEEVVKGG